MKKKEILKRIWQMENALLDIKYSFNNIENTIADCLNTIEECKDKDEKKEVFLFVLGCDDSPRWHCPACGREINSQTEIACPGCLAKINWK